MAVPKYVLDSNCYIDADRDPASRQLLRAFVAVATPFIYLSSVVAAELRMGATVKARRRLEQELVEPFECVGRILAPSAAAWTALGTTLAALVEEDGRDLRTVKRSFIFDVLLAYSCREVGAVLVSRNATDLARIKRVFDFKYAAPFPELRG